MSEVLTDVYPVHTITTSMNVALYNREHNISRCTNNYNVQSCFDG